MLRAVNWVYRLYKPELDLDWIHDPSMDWIGPGQQKLTHVQLW